MMEPPLPGSALTEECLAHFRQGSNLAYMKMVCHFSEPLNGFVFRLTGNAKASAEIVQDSFNQLWLRHEIIYTAAGIEAFLYTAARWSCFIYLERPNYHGSIFQR